MKTFADVVRTDLELIMDQRTPGEAYNIGVESPEITVLELARRLAMLGSELFGYSGQIMHGKSGDPNYLVDNPSCRCPIVAKARGELGYAPQVGLDEGLRRSLLWYSGNSEAAEA
jgi:UDP-glucuronate decarboxylase